MGVCEYHMLHVILHHRWQQRQKLGYTLCLQWSSTACWQALPEHGLQWAVYPCG